MLYFTDFYPRAKQAVISSYIPRRSSNDLIRNDWILRTIPRKMILGTYNLTFAHFIFKDQVTLWNLFF